MVILSPLLAEDVQTEILAHYSKIKTQQSQQRNKNGGIAKRFTYTLCDTSEPFEIDAFIETVRPILNRFKINFAMGFILREEIGVTVRAQRVCMDTRV